MTSASARIKTSPIRKYCTFRRKRPRISGNVLRNSSALKKASRTAGQFGERRMNHVISPSTTTVLTTAIRTPFAPSARSPPNSRDPPGPSPSGSGAPGGDATSCEMRPISPPPPRTMTRRLPPLLQDGDLADVRLLGEPGRLDLLERPIALHLVERLVHAADHGAAPSERHAEVLALRR